MRKSGIALLLLALAGGPAALGQGGGEAVPRIDQMDFMIYRYIGGRSFTNFDFVYLFDLYAGFPALWADPVAFNPDTELAEELDIILVTAVVVDEDLTEEDSDLDFFYRVRAGGSAGPPEAPPLYGATPIDKFAAIDNFVPFPPPPANAILFAFSMQVPRIDGVNQSRLRGLIDWDVFWVVTVDVANEEDPEDGKWTRIVFSLFAVQNPALVPPNPPAFADAGPDRTAAAGSTVTLDATRTFDSSNLGFDTQNPNVFEKDTLTYAWEWLSGPERVDPQPSPDGNPAKAVVTLELVGDYVYQVVVEDGVNALPSTDSTIIHVVQSIRENLGPSAVISDADGRVVSEEVVSVQVGDRITLSAAPSADPDGDSLAYRWRQTNEVGGRLMSDEVLTDFQPLNGIGTRDVSWVATTAGTFYFSLLVSDIPPVGLDSLSSTAGVTVDVAEATTAGTVAARASDKTSSSAEGADATPDNAADTLPATPVGCGGGSLLPLALLPGALWLLRGKRG